MATTLWKWLLVLVALPLLPACRDAYAQIVRPSGTPRAAATSRPESQVRIPGLGSDAYEDLILESNPTVYLRLNETSGTTANDSSAAGTNDGTYAGTPSFDQDGVLGTGGAVDFNGTDARISSTYSPSITDFTFEAWFKVANGYNTGLSTFVSWQENGGSGGGLAVGIGAAPGGIGATGTIWMGWTEPFIVELARTSTTWNDGNWHHVVAVWDGTAGVEFDASQITLYVDGVSQAITEETFANKGGTAPYTTNRAYYAGTLADSWDNFTDVTLDEVALYTTTLSAAVVDEHYDSGDPQ